MNHQLNAVQVQYVQQVRQQMKELRQAYLAGLGAAKEAEIVMDVLRTSMNQQLLLIQQELPPGHYELSEDGTMLMAVDAAPAPTSPPPAPQPTVNGALHEN